MVEYPADRSRTLCRDWVSVHGQLEALRIDLWSHNCKDMLWSRSDMSPANWSLNCWSHMGIPGELRAFWLLLLCSPSIVGLLYCCIWELRCGRRRSGQRQSPLRHCRLHQRMSFLCMQRLHWNPYYMYEVVHPKYKGAEVSREWFQPSYESKDSLIGIYHVIVAIRPFVRCLLPLNEKAAGAFWAN